MALITQTMTTIKVLKRNQEMHNLDLAFPRILCGTLQNAAQSSSVEVE